MLICNYKAELNKLLLKIPVEFVDFVACNDFNCNTHNDAISNFGKHIVRAILQASELCLPKTKKSKKIQGWNEYVQPFLDESLLHHEIWKQHGRLRDGFVSI